MNTSAAYHVSRVLCQDIFVLLEYVLQRSIIRCPSFLEYASQCHQSLVVRAKSFGEPLEALGRRQLISSSQT